MNTEEIKSALRKAGSKDVEKDAALIEKMTSQKTENRLKAQAVNLTDKRVLLNIVPGSGSYSTTSGNIPAIVIDPMTLYEPNMEEAMMMSILKGVTSHEAGHILYSDFSAFGREVQKAEGKQKAIQKAGEEYLHASEEDKPDAVDNLRKAIIEYIKAQNMKTMINSVEDGAVEHLVPLEFKRTYGDIVNSRNALVALERKEKAPKGKETLEHYMMDMRHYCTYGYRKADFKPLYLPNILSKQEIKEVRTLCIWSRICSADTEERIAVSKVLMDYLEPAILPKAEEFLTKYLSSIQQMQNMSDNEFEEMADSMMPNDSELSIIGGMDERSTSSPMPQPKPQYEMELPEELQKKLEDKKEESQNESDGDSKSGSGNDSSENEENSSSNESSSGESGSESNSASGNQNSANADSGNDSEIDSEFDSGENGGENSGSNESSSSSEDNEAKEKGKSKKNSESSDLKAESGESENASAGMEGKTEDNEGKTYPKKTYDAAAEEADAKAASAESLNKIQKELEKAEINNDRKNFNPNGSGKAPEFSEYMPSCDSFSKMHEGVKVQYSSSKCFSSPSSAGRQVQVGIPELKKQASKFSRKLKELLMYRAKNRDIRGLKRGNLNTHQLSRIVTDKKVFHKRQEGEKSKARIEVLMDLSGSMYGEKIRDAIAAAYMLAEACAQVGVPISVMGHATPGYKVELSHFLEFKNYRKKEAREKILCAEAGGGNRDGLAIFYSGTDLQNHSEKGEKKILIVISDGSPADYDYGGNPAEEDIRSIIAKMERQWQITTIGVGIGSDIGHIPRIYKNAVPVPEVSKLSEELLKILRNAILS